MDGMFVGRRKAATVDRGLQPIDRQGCLTLLASSRIGRVVYTEAAMPAAHPVNYLLDGDEVVFRTGSGTKLTGAERGIVLGFQVDEIDIDRRTGWSVMGVGEAYEIVDPGRLADLAERLPPPWAPDRDGHCVGIPLQRLTGRWLRPPGSAQDAPSRPDTDTSGREAGR